MTSEEFLRQAAEAARASSAASGFPPGVTVAQAALESAWGRSRLATEANNYFGIKVHGGMPSIALPTVEIVAAAPVRVVARFARYASMADCFHDRDAILARVPLYAEARAASADPEAFTRALAKRWATDPQYADKVLAIYRTHRLDALDR
ncbi:MAG TPA: glucosaminidase domain-containing protein [Terriglobales bacterium]|nr:glucosaminidase domain-containing protein [Terriglobales bacterium]